MLLHNKRGKKKLMSKHVEGISLDEFDQFCKAKNKTFNNVHVQPSLYSFDRLRLTNLDINKYIYIADHYEELKEKFKAYKK